MYIGHNVFLDILEALSRGGHFDKIPQVTIIWPISLPSITVPQNVSFCSGLPLFAMTLKYQLIYVTYFRF